MNVKRIVKYFFFIVCGLMTLNGVGQESYNDSLLNELSSSSDPHQKAIILNTLAEQSHRFESGQSITYAKKALKLSEQHQLKKQEQTAYRFIGHSYYYLDLYDKSYDNLLKSLSLAEELKDSTDIAFLLNTLAAVHLRMGEFPSAIDYYERAILINTQIGDSTSLLKTMGNMAIAQNQMGKVDEALDIFNQLVRKYSQDNNYHDAAIGYYQIGYLYLGEKIDYSKAILNFEKSVELCEKVGIPDLHVFSLLNIAAAYIRKKEYKKALIYNDRAKELYQDGESYATLRTLSNNYSIIYFELGEYKKAYVQDTLFNHYRNLETNETTVTRVNNLKLLYDDEKKTSELRKSQIKVQTLNSIRDKETVLKYVLIIIIMLLIAIVILIIRNYRLKLTAEKFNKLQLQREARFEKVQLEKETNFQKNELHKMALSIIRSQEFNDEIVSKLKSVLKRKEEDWREEIKELLIKLQALNTTNNDKKEFQLYLDKVNTTFMFKLEDKYPSLSEDDKRICLLIFIGFKTKEIAVVMNLSQRSIENKRTRLRQKLNLQPEDDLYESIKSIQ